jgi:hypothetical protein
METMAIMSTPSMSHRVAVAAEVVLSELFSYFAAASVCTNATRRAKTKVMKIRKKNIMKSQIKFSLLLNIR